MMHTSIYSRCPSCHQDGLVQHMQASYRCAVCNFDYVTLANNDAAMKAWMLENLRLGPMNVVFVLHLHQVILQLPAQESNARVLAFATQNGIRLPTGSPFSPLKIVAVVIGVFVVLFAVALFFAARR